MYGLEISNTELTVIWAAARARRAKSMFWPVLAASGSMMMADEGTPSVMDSFPAREAGRGGGAVSPGEDQHREQARAVQVRGEGRHSQVVAAQADAG
jgi:hypothetical protein